MELWRKNLYILWGAQFLAMAGMNLVVPFLPFYIRTLGVTDSGELARWSGLVFAGPFLTSFIATPIWGALGDKYGRKTMVVRAIIGLGISQIFIGFSQSVVQLLLFRTFQGAISGFIAAVLALVSTSTPKEKTGYALGLLQSATAGGGVLGPLLGGFLADSIGYRQVFFLVAALCFISGAVIFKFVHEVPHQDDGSPRPSVFKNFGFTFSHSQLRLVTIAILVAQGGALMIEPIFALFIEGFKTETTRIATLAGMIFSIPGFFMLFSAPWWGRRNDKHGFKKNIIISFLGTGVAYVLHMIVPNLVALSVVRAALGFVRGGILHALYSVTAHYAPANRKGGLMGIASSFAVLGNMAGPVFGGIVAEHFSIRNVLLINSALFFVMSWALWKYFVEPSHEKIEEPVEVIETTET